MNRRGGRAGAQAAAAAAAAAATAVAQVRRERGPRRTLKTGILIDDAPLASFLYRSFASSTSIVSIISFDILAAVL